MVHSPEYACQIKNDVFSICRILAENCQIAKANLLPEGMK
jgi:hypothetical protein